MRLGFKERQLGQHLQALQENFAIQTELAGRERREQRVHGVPLPPPEPPDDGVLTPQDQLKTSISSFFRKIFALIVPSRCKQKFDCRGRRPSSEIFTRLGVL